MLPCEAEPLERGKPAGDFAARGVVVRRALACAAAIDDDVARRRGGFNGTYRGLCHCLLLRRAAWTSRCSVNWCTVQQRMTASAHADCGSPDVCFATPPTKVKVAIMKVITTGPLLAVILCTLLSACATSTTRVTTSSDAYKSMTRSQQWWCSQFGLQLHDRRFAGDVLAGGSMSEFGQLSARVAMTNRATPQ